MAGSITKVKWLGLSLFSRDAKVLLAANIIFSLVLPLDVIFSNAYIWRQKQDFALLFASNCSGFAGVPVGYILNGFLLRRFPIKNIFVASMTGSVLMITVLFFLGRTTYPVVMTLGFCTGTAMGIYWSNRLYMALMKTHDGNRNYFNSIELLASVVADVVTAFLAGMFIGHAHYFGLTPNQAYKIVILLALLLVLTAGLILRKGNFVNPKIRRFLYTNYVRRWQNMRKYSLALGVVEGCTLILPTLLILKFLGNESSLGLVESCSMLLSMGVVYFAGRFCTPAHRTLIVITSVLLILAGSILFGVLYSALGVIFFQISNIFSKPLQEIAFRSTMMRSVDFAAGQEHRDQYAYLIDNEIVRFLGRLAGAGVFMALYFKGSEEIALRVALIVLALMLSNTIWLSRLLNPREINLDKNAQSHRLNLLLP